MDKLTLSLVTWWSPALLKCGITWNTFQVKILLFSQYFCLSFCLPQGKVLGIEIHYFQKPMPCKGDGRSEISQWEQKAGSHLAHDPNSSLNQEIGNLDAQFLHSWKGTTTFVQGGMQPQAQVRVMPAWTASIVILFARQHRNCALNSFVLYIQASLVILVQRY